MDLGSSWVMRGLVALAAARAATLYSRPLPKRLKGKCVLVTGAAHGVGRLTALQLASRGVHLVLWDIQVAALDDTVAAIRRAYPGVGVVSVVCDLAKREDVYAAAERTKKECEARWGQHVSVVINNAGIVSGSLFLDSDDRKNELTMAVNCHAHMWTTKAFLPEMIRRADGHICSVASIASYIAAPGMVDYACSKAGARAFAEGLSRELKATGTRGVGVTCVCPVHINTELFKGFESEGLTLDASAVASAIISAIETNQELVLLPGLVGRAGIAVKMLYDICGQLGMPSSVRALKNPMHRVDLTAAERTFHAMRTAKL